MSFCVLYWVVKVLYIYLRCKSEKEDVRITDKLSLPQSKWKYYILRTFGHSKKNVEKKMKQTNEYSVDGREDKKF